MPTTAYGIHYVAHDLRPRCWLTMSWDDGKAHGPLMVQFVQPVRPQPS